MRNRRVDVIPHWPFPIPHSGQLVPGEWCRLVALVAYHLIHSRIERLPVPAHGAHGVGEREDARQARLLARLAAHNAPALRRVVTDLEEAAIHRHVAAGDVEPDDVTRGK